MSKCWIDSSGGAAHIIDLLLTDCERKSVNNGDLEDLVLNILKINVQTGFSKGVNVAAAKELMGSKLGG